uniref:hemerythrin domain-containing protein n=1 Tax=Aliarcobacter sp. TaxID=2321116 RepID=UPI0040482B27
MQTISNHKTSISWRSEYNINNFKIDTEHQRLFSIAREALNISKLQNNKEVKTKLKEIIIKLFKYVNIHFENEEKYMKDIKYPDLERHKLLHKSMLKMLTNLISHLNLLSHEEIENKIFAFIEEYFIKHIIIEDKKIQLSTLSLEELRKNSGWRDVYSVNNGQIDAEHKQLFEIAQEAFEEVEPKLIQKRIKEVLLDLYDYMKIHFEHEETFMEEIKYPKRKEHKELHNRIITIINNFVRELPKINENIAKRELARIIDIILVQHIIQEDRKIISWEKSEQ